MEITINLPIGEWYQNTTRNDLQYWGLDYPPLTAFGSFLCGKIFSWIEPEFMELFSSRGYESYTSKLMMRGSVIVSDIVIWIPAALLFATLRYRSFGKLVESRVLFVFTFLLFLPPLLLIDHGHFQYNSVSLGFTLWAICFIFLDADIFASFMFCLALNYKQMSLYHSAPFFFYLLGKSFKNRSILALFSIAFTVVITFSMLWFPFFFEPAMLNDERTGPAEKFNFWAGFSSLGQVLHRIFPVARGLFEDKVANFWCVASPVLKLRTLFELNQLALIR